MNADPIEPDDCEHGVPTYADCCDCMKRRHADEERALNDEADRLTGAIQSALCMLVEGPDAIGGFEARQQAIKILSDALQGGTDAR